MKPVGPVPSAMSARETVRDYYEALRRGEPLYPYFAEREDLVKVAISERLVGYDAVAEALREQTRTTEDWTIESTDLRVTERGDVAWFADAVRMEWTLARHDERVEHDARWSGVLERRAVDRSDGSASDATGTTRDSEDAEWLFVGMHVSTASDVVE